MAVTGYDIPHVGGFCSDGITLLQPDDRAEPDMVVA